MHYNYKLEEQAITNITKKTKQKKNKNTWDLSKNKK